MSYITRFEKNYDETYADFIKRVLDEHLNYSEFWEVQNLFIIEDGMTEVSVHGRNDDILKGDNFETRVLAELAHWDKIFDHEAPEYTSREVTPAASVGVHISEFCQAAIHQARRMCRHWNRNEETSKTWQQVVLFVEFNGTNVEVPNLFASNAAELLEVEIRKEMDTQRNEYLNSDAYKEKEAQQLAEVNRLKALIPALETELPTIMASWTPEDFGPLLSWAHKYAQLADRTGVSDELNVEAIKFSFSCMGIYANMNVGMAKEMYEDPKIRYSWLLGQFIELLGLRKGIPGGLLKAIEDELDALKIPYSYL